jgi:predicted lipid-binding transport protein (Tim44 family)
MAALRKLQAEDARVLAAYGSRLRARTDGDIAKMQADLQARTNANLAARERVLAAQTSTQAQLQLPASHARGGSPADMRAQYDALVNAQPADATAFTNARDDLASKFRTLHDTDAANTASIRSQIGWLRHDRDAVRKRMIAQIMEQAQREAKARGLSDVVSDEYHAARGSVDLTSAVAADLKALSP